MTTSIYESFFSADERPDYTPADIEIYPVPSSTLNIELEEKIDVELLELCIESPEVKRLIIRRDDMKPFPVTERLQEMRDKLDKGILKVRYVREKRYGRVYPDKSLSFGTVPKVVRHRLLGKNWVDIDMKNAQVEILRQFCMKLNIIPVSLNRYCDERDTCFQEVAKAYKLSNGKKLDVEEDRDTIKAVFITFMFYGSFDCWKKQYDIHHSATIEDCKFLMSLKQDLKMIGRGIMAHNKSFFDEICEEPKQDKRKNKKEKIEVNHIGKAMSYFLQEYERRILDVMYDYVKDKVKYIILSFDGIMIYQPPSTLKIDEMRSIIKEKTGYDIELVIKAMDKGNEITVPTYEIPCIAMKQFDIEVLNNIPVYTQKKRYFERFFTKILSQSGIIQLHYTSENRYTFNYSIDGFKKSFSHIPFVKNWIDDEEIKASQCLDFEPMNKTETEMLDAGDGGNLFTGYNDCVREDLPYDDIGVREWLRLVEDLCEGNKDYAEYYVKILAQKVLYPTKRMNIAVVMLGDQGTGKNKHLEPIRDIIGKRHYISSAKEDDFFGDYAEGFQNKLIVNMNEVEGKNTLDLQGRIKSFITEDQITVNMKFVRPIQIKNYSLLTIFSNKVNPIQIDVRSGDRRFFVVKAKGQFKGKRKYWDRVSEIFQGEIFLSSVYKYFCSINLEGFNAEKERPETFTYNSMRSLVIPKEVLFIESIYTQELIGVDENSFDRVKNEILDKERDENGKHFYEDYIAFLRDRNMIDEKVKIQDRKFYAELLNLDVGVNKYKDRTNKTRVMFKLRNVLAKLATKKLSSILPAEICLDDDDIAL